MGRRSRHLSLNSFAALMVIAVVLYAVFNVAYSMLPALAAGGAALPSENGTGYLDIDPVTYVLDDNNNVINNFSGLLPSSQFLFGVTMPGVFGAGNSAISGDPGDPSLPASYDGRKKGYASAVLNQQNTNLCWDFSTMSAIESYMLASDSKSARNYSETNAAYALSLSVSPLGFVRSVIAGGNFQMAMAYATRWQGPVLYSLDPFSANIGAVSRTAAQNVKPTALHIQGYQAIPSDFNAIKNAIMDYGSVVCSLYMNTAAPVYNPKTASMYNTATAISDHQIQIVGWDNDYPEANFGTDPGANGAWIVKNSWGTGFGAGGFMYVSYFDTTIAKDVCAVTDVEPVGNYDNIYLYDPFGQVAYINYNDASAWYANTFTPNSSAETLKAVSFYNLDANASYQIYCGTSLADRTLVASGNVANCGYYTVPLKTPVKLTGAPFTVFVKLTASGGIADVPIETNISNYITSATSGKGESYISSDGKTWADITAVIPKSNVCLRAFTANS